MWGMALSAERNLIVSLLKLTKENTVLIETVKKDSRLPSETIMNLLEKMQNEDLIYLKPDSAEVTTTSRLKLAVKAASLGADIEHISNLLCWQEFEEIAAFALKSNGYIVQNNVRFTQAGHRWEIDVVGCKKPQVLCVDCKHWQHAISAAALRKIVDAQTQRTKALADSLPNVKLKLECTKWEKAKFLPAVLSLMPSSFKFYHEVPVVPVLSLQDFLCQLPLYVETVKFIPKTFSSLNHNL
jgi:Holliday junction resolvase-like predicted endonuclease